MLIGPSSFGARDGSRQLNVESPRWTLSAVSGDACTERVSMREELLAFLGSFKNSESISPELRDAIQVSTSLEDHVLGAMRDGRLTLLTGSAGSGKTHLLE